MTPVKEARKRGMMTIYDVAKRARIDASSISRIERGQQQATARTAERIAKVLGITEEQVLYPEKFVKRPRRKAA